MIEQIPTAFKIFAIAAGSGFAVISEMYANVSAFDGNLDALGGWGVAVAGLYTLWKDLKHERGKRDEQHEILIKHTSESTQALKDLQTNCASKCGVKPTKRTQ